MWFANAVLALLLVVVMAPPAWAGGGGGGGGVAQNSVPWLPTDMLLALQLGVAFAAWRKRR